MTYRECPNCGTKSGASDTYCEECGEDVSDVETKSDSAFNKLPGIDLNENTTRRNVLAGGAYTFVGIGFFGAVASSAETENNQSGDVSGNNGGGGGGGGGGDSTTHDVGDTFTVGNGSKSIEYTILDVSTQEAVGSGIAGEEADGQFVVVNLEMTNVGDESFSLSSNVFRVETGGNEYETDSDAVFSIEDNVIFEQLDPQLTTEGTLVFDVPADSDTWSLKIEPAGILSSAESHTVELS